MVDGQGNPVLATTDFIFTVINSMGEGVCVLDREGRIIFANDTAGRILGRPPSALTGASFTALLEAGPEIEAGATGESLLQLADEKFTLRDIEAGLQTHDGRQVVISFTASPAVVSENETHVTVVFRDITRQRELEKQLSIRERQLAMAEAQTGLGSWDWDLTANEVHWTDELFHLYGYEPGEVEPSFELAMEHIHEEDRSQVIEVIEAASGRGEPFAYTCRLVRRDGTERTMRVLGSVRRDVDDELLRMWGTAQDVTERQRREEAIRHSEERFRTIFEAAEMCILLLSLDGTIIQANPAWQTLSRRLRIPDEAQAWRLEDTVLPADTGRLHAALVELAAGRVSSQQEELRLRTSETEPIWVDGVFSRLNGPDGRPRRLIAMLENVTARKRVEQELREVKRRLSRSRENERLRLAQDLHDGPIQDLYATNYQLQALKRTSLNDRQAALLNNALAQFQLVSDRLRAVTNELRPPALAAFGLESAIRSHADRFQKLYPDLTISLQLDDGIVNLPEYAGLTLYRICQEMLSNVARHAEATRVLIAFGLEADHLVLEIQDNGRGFEVPERWIELARRGHLGLLGASERAEEIDGDLVIFSTPGQGTIVRVTAPSPQPAAPPAEGADPHV